MFEVASEELHFQQPGPSLIDVLHDSPRLCELLPQCSRQMLAATCSSLHTWFRQQIIFAKIGRPYDLLRLKPSDWPKLAAVHLRTHMQPKDFGRATTDIHRHLQGHWHLDVEIHLEKPYDACTSRQKMRFAVQHDWLLLISPLGRPHLADHDLSPQQYEILSQFVDTEQRNTTQITISLQRQPEDATTARTESSPSFLPGNLWFCFGRQKSPQVYALHLRHQQWSLACAQSFVRCSFPSLCIVRWCGGNLSAPVCAVLNQARLPSLRHLFLTSQCITAAGLPELLRGSWCTDLESLHLEGNALGEEGAKALCLGRWRALEVCGLVDCGMSSHAAVTYLARARFPKLRVMHLTGNHFEAGAIACLAVAQWRKLEHMTLSWQDLDVGACDVLGVCRAAAARYPCSPPAQQNGYAALKKEEQVCVHLKGSVFPSIKTITLVR